MAGGIAFGYYAYKSPADNPLLDGLADGEAAITPYVKIDARGVTLITPRADMGQGAISIQAYLIAEELDVDPRTVRLSQGVPSPAYYNSKVIDEGFPFAATDEGFAAQTARDAGDVITKLIGLQVTGGSTTVPDAYEKLRLAGAVARETLKEAAAQETGVARSDLTTADGVVLLPDGRSLKYAALAPRAAKLTPVTDVELRPPTAWRFLGKTMQRVDIVAKSTGTQSYGIDVVREDLVYATVRTNPGLGAGVASYDATEARKMRGVSNILPVRNGLGVIADNTWRAIQAANAIEITWQPAAYPPTTAAMWEKVEGAFNDTHRDSRFKDDGNVEARLGSGDVVTAEYRIPYLAHAPLEPMNATALYTGDRLDIWTGTQIPRFVQSHAADLSGLASDKVHVHVQAIGGSFGRRLDDTHVMQAVELAMAVKGKPVKLTWSREEDMTHDYPRPMQIGRGRGATADGRVEAFDLAVASQSVSASWFGRLLHAPPGPDMTLVAGAWDQPFAIPHYRVSGYRVPEMVPVSAWRSVGASGNGFFHDCFLDELIHAAGADPLAERLRLCNHDLSRKVLEAVGEMANWNGPRIAEGRGRGISFTLSFGVPVAQVVEVVNTSEGIRIDKVFVAAEVGRILDPVNFEAQIQGGVIWGLGHAMNCALTYKDYAPEQTNFHAYEGMRLRQTPEIVVRGLENGEVIRGIGEPSVPPAAPALANAIFAATGKRIRELPLDRHIDFA